MPEEKKWDKLRNKWKTKKKVKEQKPPVRMKEIAYRLKNYTIVLLMIAVPLSIGVMILLYQSLTTPVYNDVETAVEDMFSLGDVATGGAAADSDVTYSLSKLPTGHCYWVRPTYNGTHSIIELIDYNSEDSCSGIPVDTSTFVLDTTLNIETDDCICSKDKLKIIKSLNDYGISLKIVERLL